MEFLKVADVSLKASITALAERWRQSGRKLHRLINAAAVTPATRQNFGF